MHALRPRPTQSLLLAFAISVVLGCQAAASPTGTATPGVAVTPAASVAPVVRIVLAEGLPAEAKGYNLQLVRYVIQPNTTLAVHHHPGTQIAMIEEGRLTYTVLTGEVMVRDATGATRTLKAGTTDVIVQGEWVVERETSIHFGANLTDKVVTILATTLLLAGQPASIADPAPIASPKGS